MRFAHEGIIHQTYLEAALHYLRDWYVIIPILTTLGVVTLIVTAKALGQKNERKYE